MDERISRGKAIRLKCLDCCCGSAHEVKLCTVEKCPLHPFRFGTDPYRTKRELSSEQIEQQRRTLAVARSSKLNSQGKSPNAHSEGIYIPEE